jgi:hypothetical protein
MSPRGRFMRSFYVEEVDTVPVTFAYVDPYAELDDQRKSLGYDRFHELVREETDVMLPKGPRAPGIFYSSTKEAKVETETRQERNYSFRCDTLTTPSGILRAKRKSEKGINTAWTYEGYIKTEEDVERLLSIPYEPLEVDMTPVNDAQKMLGERGVVATGVADAICCAAELFTLRDYALTGSRKPRTMMKLLRFFGDRIEDYVRQASEQSTDVFYRIVGPEYVTKPILPPRLFEDYVVPFDRRLVRIIKKNDNIAAIHCHGQLRTVMKGIRRIDPHVLEPIEPPPQGDITLREIKERIGDRTSLMGHIQYNDLEFDPPETIRKKVRSVIDQGAPGGGYILFPTAEPIARISDRLLTNMKEFVSSGRHYGRY